MSETKGELKKFSITVDLTDLRQVCVRYGPAAVDAAVDKIANDLKLRVKKALALDSFSAQTKTLVEG